MNFNIATEKKQSLPLLVGSLKITDPPEAQIFLSFSADLIIGNK